MPKATLSRDLTGRVDETLGVRTIIYNADLGRDETGRVNGTLEFYGPGD